MASMNYSGANASIGAWWDSREYSREYSREPTSEYPPYTQSHQHQSRTVLAAVHGELKNLMSLIEQELHSHQQDASSYEQQDRFLPHGMLTDLHLHLQDDPAFVSAARVPVTQAQYAQKRRGPSAAPPAMQSTGDSGGDSRARGIGPSAAPPASPSFGDSDALFRGGVRFNQRGSSDSIIDSSSPVVPSSMSTPSRELQQATTYGRERTASQSSGSANAEDKHDLPPVPEELMHEGSAPHPSGPYDAEHRNASYEDEEVESGGETMKKQNSFNKTSLISTGTMDTMELDQLIAEKGHSPNHDRCTFVTSGQKNQLHEMFAYLTKESCVDGEDFHRSFLTADECLRVLKLSAPELLWERNTLVRVLAKLDAFAGTAGRYRTHATSMALPKENVSEGYDGMNFGGAVCDFKAFCWLMGQFDPKSFEDEDVSYEMKEYMIHLAKAFRKHARQLEEEEKIKRLTDEGDGPFKGKLALAFDTIPAFVILANAVVIGVSADVMAESVVWEALELFFLFFFTAEFALKARFAGVTLILYGPDKWWNYFDLFCIVTAVIDQFFVYLERFSSGGGFDIGSVIPISLLKMLKLVRLARLVRLLRFKIFHELKMMVQGVVSGVKVLIWAIVLLFFCIFCLGIVMRKIVGEEQPEFSNLPAAMFTLFRCFTDGCSAYDGTPLAERLRHNLGETSFGIVWMASYILVILFVTIGIFNLIMAIFIDNVVTAQMQRKQQQLGETADAMEIRINEVIGARFSITDEGERRLSGSNSRDLSGSTDVKSHGRAAICVPSEENDDHRPWWKRWFWRLMGMADPNQYTIEGKKKLMAQRRSKVSSLMVDLDDEERVVTREVFSEWLREPEILGLLEEVEVETSTKWELFDALDVDGGGELTVDELVSGLMKLRGPVSKNDIVATRLKLTYVTELVEDICRKLGIKLSSDRETLKPLSWNPNKQAAR